MGVQRRFVHDPSRNEAVIKRVSPPSAKRSESLGGARPLGLTWSGRVAALARLVHGPDLRNQFEELRLVSRVQASLTAQEGLDIGTVESWVDVAALDQCFNRLTIEVSDERINNRLVLRKVACAVLSRPSSRSAILINRVAWG